MTKKLKCPMHGEMLVDDEDEYCPYCEMRTDPVYQMILWDTNTDRVIRSEFGRELQHVVLRYGLPGHADFCRAYGFEVMGLWLDGKMTPLYKWVEDNGE